MTIRKSGASIIITAMFKGTRVERQYWYYTTAEAKRLFYEHLKSMNVD